MYESFRQRIVKSFIDILILMELEKSPLTGYSLIGLINNKFMIFVSPGTIYNSLHSLEAKDLVKGFWKDKKRIYIISSRGKEFLKVIRSHKKEILGLLDKVFS